MTTAERKALEARAYLAELEQFMGEQHGKQTCSEDRWAIGCAKCRRPRHAESTLPKPYLTAPPAPA